MKLSNTFAASALLTLLLATTAAAHDPDEMAMRFPALKKEAATPITCTELAAADKDKLNHSDPDIQALDKQCKAEAAKAKAAEAAKKKPVKK